MESEISEAIRCSSINVNLEIRIEDFVASNKSSKKGEYFEHSESGLNAWFSVSASPNGLHDDTEGWLVVRPFVTVLRGKYRPQNSELSWTVSAIDFEGNKRFPRSFTQNLSEDLTDAKYLERSFILDRADEFLLEGVLTIHCDICFQWYNDTPALVPGNLKTAVRIVPEAQRRDREFDVNDSETEDPLVVKNKILKIPESSDSDVPGCLPEPSPIEDFADFVAKNKILTEVLYLAHLGKVSAICDPPPPKDRHPKVWKFVTCTESFNLILDGRLNSIGTRLLKASPVIRKCVNTPMKERLEKCIELPTVDGQTFKNVLYFITKGILPKFEFGELMEIYKFSHLYEIEVLQRNCAEDMLNSLEHESDFKELQKLADFFSDVYFSELLHIRRHGHENLEGELPQFRMDDKPYSDSYV